MAHAGKSSTQSTYADLDPTWVHDLDLDRLPATQPLNLQREPEIEPDLAFDKRVDSGDTLVNSRPPSPMDYLVGNKRKFDEDKAAIDSRAEAKRRRVDARPLDGVLPPQLPKFDGSPIGVPVVELAPPLFDPDQMARLPWLIQWELARKDRDSFRCYDDIDLPTYRSKCTSTVDWIEALNKELKPVHRINLDRQVIEIMEQEECMNDRPDDALTRAYPGYIHFNATLQLSPDSKRFVLQRATKSHSCRLARKFGSASFIRVSCNKIADDGVDRLIEFCLSAFKLHNRLFDAIYHKDSTIYLFLRGEHTSLVKLIRFINPIEENANQKASKWVSRFALGFSASEPTATVEEVNFHVIPDEYADGKSATTAETEHIMTDGIGSANGAFFKQIKEIMGWEFLPQAVQGRYRGAKGVWIQKPEHESDKIPRIWIRHSQCKIQYSEADPHLQTFDLVAPNRVTFPARLGLDAINCLAHGGVTAQHLTPFIESLMNRCFMALTDWDGPNKSGCCERLALFLQNEGLATAIQQRLYGGSARAYGFGFGRQREEQVDDDVDQLPVDKWAPNPLSGCPARSDEFIVTMLQAGFDPNTNLILRRKLRNYFESTVKTQVLKGRVEIPQSVRLMMIADPFHTLEPGECFVQFSRALPLPDGTLVTCLDRDVLVMRDPIKLPGDVQKMKAVRNTQLSAYSSGLDVLVLPSRGSVAPASLLSGGDLDGDTAMVLFCPDIVNAFAPVSPQDSTRLSIEVYFTTDRLDMGSLCEELYIHNDNGEEAANQYLKRHLLDSLRHAQYVGIYGRLHENAIYKKGFSSDEAITLAHIFNTCMDSAKSGRRIKPEVFEKHKRQFHLGSRPAYVPVSPDGAAAVERDSYLGRHIVDAILEDAKKMQTSYNRRFQDIVDRKLSPFDKDEDLRGPWNDLLQRCSPDQLPYLAYEQLDRDMRKIEQHIRQCRSQFKSTTSGYWATRDAERLGFKTPSKRRGSSRYQDGRSFQETLSLFAANPELEYLHHDPEELARIKASYAYFMEWPFEEEIGSGGLNFPSDFAFEMAFTELCKIKAAAVERRRGSAGPIAMTRSFAHASVLKSRVVDSLSSTHRA